MMKIVSLIAAALILSFLTGCFPEVKFAPANTQTNFASRTRPENIELYRATLPQKKYVEVGGMSFCCSRDVTSIVDLFRQKASVAGGDALIGLDFDATGAATASVIRYQ